MRCAVLLAIAMLPGLAQAEGLTEAERASFTTQIAQCWNVGALADGAEHVVVTVSFQLDAAAKPIAESLKLVNAGEGDTEAAQQAYQSARRAILRCGARGYKLPLEKLGSKRNIDVTFNPERMRLK